jgi:hypothetical protein
MKKLTLLIAMLMATSAWAEVTRDKSKGICIQTKNDSMINIFDPVFLQECKKGDIIKFLMQFNSFALDIIALACDQEKHIQVIERKLLPGDIDYSPGAVRYNGSCTYTGKIISGYRKNFSLD